MGQEISGPSAFADLIDLASERMGGRTYVAASDEFFAPKENLLKPGRAVFIPDKYTERGKWMDGWESRRKREPGHDWCTIALGRSGIIHGVNVDTGHFKGNQPESCTIDAAELPGSPDADSLSAPSVKWTPVIARTLLKPEHPIPALPAVSGKRFTHIRLNIFPDGGVARLRVFGEVLPDWKALAAGGEPIDLAAAENGALVIACNDMHFGSRHNLIMPGRAANMGDGWETRRKRGLTWEGLGGGKDGRPVEHDWAVIRLARRGTISRIEVDTNHFKGNFPESCRIDVSDVPPDRLFDPVAAAWATLLPRTKLQADTRHLFERELDRAGTIHRCTHARLNIYPDGGISRLRLWGKPI